MRKEYRAPTPSPGMPLFPTLHFEIAKDFFFDGNQKAPNTKFLKIIKDIMNILKIKSCYSSMDML